MFERLKASVTGLFAKHAPDVRDAIENIGEVASAQAARAKEFAGDAVEKVSELKDEAVIKAAMALDKADDFKDEVVAKVKKKTEDFKKSDGVKAGPITVIATGSKKKAKK